MIVGFFSVATYVRYRAAALKAFDVDLQSNLDTLQNALGEEIREALGAAAAASVPPLQTAANEAVAAFRLNGLYAEIRVGDRAERPLARVAGAQIEEGGRLLDDAAWSRLAGSSRAQVLDLAGGRRGVARSVREPETGELVTLVVADRTTLVEQTLSSIRASLIEFGAAGLFLALAGGYWLATRALGPIDTLTTQAGAMAAQPSSPGGRLAIPSASDELGRLARTFNLLLERIEHSVSQTRAFIADAAHELKTPVAIIRTEAELSLSGERSLAESREALAAIAAESDHLSRLVSDLTLLAEGETLEHPVERRLVDLAELLHEVVRALRSLASSRQVTVDVEASGGQEYRGDERLLRRILMNLVENAIKFSRNGGRIGVALSETAGSLELRVVDEAPTLSAEEQQRVFQRFYRSPQTRSSGAAGSGLGLAIVEWAVTLHGGRIRVEPRTPAGNVFVVDFPAAQEP
ncbi:MAG TPA: HAMP domain-containing sensor histidine kinase [Thermoanaerobaculia bacterium]